MRVTINGEGQEVPESLTVATLLAHLEIHPLRVAVERNREILPRAKWESTAVEAGDNYEIVHMVGGG